MLEAIQDQGLDVSGIPRDRLLREKTGLEPDLRVEGNEFLVVLARKSPESV